MSLLTDEIYLSLDRINISLFFWEVKGKMGCIYLILQVLFNSFYGITVGLVILIYILFFASLLTMSIGARVVVAVTFQQVDDTPDTKTSAQSDNESLKNGNCLFKKCHIVC